MVRAMRTGRSAGDCGRHWQESAGRCRFDIKSGTILRQAALGVQIAQSTKEVLSCPMIPNALKIPTTHTTRCKRRSQLHVAVRQSGFGLPLPQSRLSFCSCSSRAVIALTRWHRLLTRPLSSQPTLCHRPQAPRPKLTRWLHLLILSNPSIRSNSKTPHQSWNNTTSPATLKGGRIFASAFFVSRPEASLC